MMQQLTTKEKEALSILCKSNNATLRIYFFENRTDVFIKKDKEEYKKIVLDCNPLLKSNFIDQIRKYIK